MAFVVGVSSVIAQEGHRVVGGDVLRMRLDKLLGAIPQCWDGLDVFVQTENKAVLFLVVLHILERIVMNVTKQFDARFDPPVVFKLVQQRMAEKEAGFESTHVSVADRVTVDDLSPTHVLANSLRLLLVNPRRERPMFHWNLSIMCLARHKRSGDLFEVVVEGFVVQEDPVIIVIPVESIFHLSN